MHNTLRQISARPLQRLTVGASGSDRPVATGETPCRVAAREGGMPRYFPLTVAASPSRPMNLGVPHDIARGDTCLRRNWWKRNKQAWSPADALDLDEWPITSSCMHLKTT